MLQTPQVQQTIAETKALGAVLAVVLQGGATDEATALVRSVFEKHRPQDPDTWLRHFAMAHILGVSITLPALASEGDGAQRLFTRTARVWMLWAGGQLEAARGLLTTPEPNHEGGEIHLMALGPWCLGLDALLRSDREEARRYFRRATEVGSQLGTETNNAIQWAFGATFFPHKP